MLQDAPGRFTYDLHMIIRNAPPVSGVYAVFSASECVYVGESDDICASLLEIFYEDQPCLNDKYLAHFSLDLVPAEVRGARQAERILELRPVCNLHTGSPECSHCRLAQEKGKGGGRRFFAHFALDAETAADGRGGVELLSPLSPEVLP